MGKHQVSWVYKCCEKHVIMRIIIKHENHHKWSKLQGICMSCTNYNIHTYPKHKESTNEYAWRHVAQGCTCINDSLDKIDIYMKSKTQDHKHIQIGSFT